MGTPPRLGFLLDVDNTLLDNDALKDALAAALHTALGDTGTERFWHLYEEVRRDCDVVDLPATVERYALETHDPTSANRLLHILDTLPFQDVVYPHTFDTLRHLATLGAVAILSDGDQVFQHMKIERSGLAAAVGGRVLIYKHKEEHLNEIIAFQPADHRVLIDDKARILDRVKGLLGAGVTTVHVLQGHYAHEPLPDGFVADITVTGIGDLRTMEATRFWQQTAD